MSLRVWLPLNGNLENKGISDITIINNGTNINDNGKIGKCYEFNTNKYLKLKDYASEFLTYNEFSLSLWFKCTGQNSAHRGSALISGGNWNQPTKLLNLALGDFDTDHYSKLFLCGAGSWDKGYSYNFYLNQWYHLTMTSGNNAIRAYVNGELIGNTYAAFKPESLAQDWICIGNGTYSQVFHFLGLMNDIRIYDHCLSTLEIKEISQALVLHYKLDGWNNGIRNYISNSKPFFYEDTSYVKFPEEKWGRSLIGGATMTNVPHEYLKITSPATRNNASQSGMQLQKVQKWTAYPNMENSIPFLETLQTGDKIAFSIETKANDFYEIRPMLTAQDGSSTVTINLLTPNTADDKYYLYNSADDLNKWNKHTFIYEVTSELYNKINSETLSRLVLNTTLTTIPNITTANKEVEILVRNFQLELSDTIHEYSPSFEDLGIDTTKIIDSSGYGHDGIANNLIMTPDSPRYSNSLKFNGTNSYVKIPTNDYLTQGMEEMTISLWAKSTNFAGAHFFSCTESGGFNTEAGNSGYLRFPLHVYTNAEKTSTAYARDSKEIKISDLSTTDWNMLTFVYTTEGTKTYINGQLHHTYTNTSYGIHLNTNARTFLGCEANTANPSAPYFNGQECDFRLYQTALSAEDIAYLYNKTTQIDNLGNLHNFDFIENVSNISIKKNGQIYANEFDENNFDTNVQFLKNTKNVNVKTIIEK